MVVCSHALLRSVRAHSRGTHRGVTHGRKPAAGNRAMPAAFRGAVEGLLYGRGSAGTTRVIVGRLLTYATHSPWLANALGQSKLSQLPSLHSSTVLGGPQRC